jgi:peroxiredoxin
VPAPAPSAPSSAPEAAAPAAAPALGPATGGRAPAPVRPAPPPSPLVGERAPDLRFVEADGDELWLSDLRGDVVLIAFWAEWCRFCNENVAALKELHERSAGSGLRVVGVSVDRDRRAFERFLERHGVTWPQHHAAEGFSGAAARAYELQALPTLFVVDRTGRIAASGVRLESLWPHLQASLVD